MQTLLSLPLELRSEILTYVLTSCIPAPSSAASNPRRTPLVDISLRAWTCQGVLYLPNNPSDIATALLLTSRQLYIETKDILSRNASANTYLLDVIFTNERALCPTWLCIPQLTTRVDTVRSNFRIIGGWGLETDGFYYYDTSAFAVGPGGPPIIVWAFYALLERFLMCGPVGALNIEGDLFDHDLDRGIIVKTLELNFLSPEDESLLAPEGLQRRWFRERRMSNNSPIWMHDPHLNPLSDLSLVVAGQMRPEWLLIFVSKEICKLLSSRSQPFQYAALLYKRIGTIKFLLNGQLFEELHLGDILSNLKREDYASKQDAELIEECEERRKEVGFLSVPVGAGDCDDRAVRR